MKYTVILETVVRGSEEQDYYVAYVEAKKLDEAIERAKREAAGAQKREHKHIVTLKGHPPILGYWFTKR